MSEKPLKLKNGDYEALFMPSSGMNFISYKKGDIEVIDQSTKNLFEERNAGLGAMIGPHFHHRQQIPPVPNESLFPHIALLKRQGVKEPFSHGIGRYAPWKVEASSDTHLKATLSGKDTWNGTTLSVLEGKDFKMVYEVHLTSKGLHISLHVESNQPSVIGLHTYYALSKKENRVISRVKNEMLADGKSCPLLPSWDMHRDQTLTLKIEDPIDCGFFPFPDLQKTAILLETETHNVRISYMCQNPDNSWQLWHPANASFVCIEPLSAQNPRHPNLKTSGLEIFIEIEPKGLKLS